ncbi:MAG: single-stranded DNA-binding protein [Solobacterium sp.]|nr:single-stranded DNA-binding protein [Solobacterium sp.]
MINRVVLVGRLTRDVEVRKTQSGISVATFTVACDRRGARDAQGQNTADFISCVAWRQPADFLGQYARKGALIGVDGRIQTRNYDDRDGKKVYVTEVVADNVRLLESRSQSESRDTGNSYGGYGSYGDPAPSYSTHADDPISSEDFNTGPSLDISSDDLPF